jgi:glucose/mannose-6-phosphate isomerase
MDNGNPVKLDPGGMSEHMMSLPDQIYQALDLADRVDLKIGESKIENVLFVGMGGSAIGGDMVRLIVSSQLDVPCGVIRYYDLPSYVGPNSLVFASSYSGNTEETISACRAASEKKANVIALTTGGKLGEFASDRGYGIAKLPEGYPPRAAIGFGIVIPTMLMTRLDLIPDLKKDFEHAAEELKSVVDEYGPSSERGTNPAKTMAESLLGKLPVVYGAEGTTGPLAVRWKGQISENGKQLAYSHVIPEMNHNEIVGWQAREDYIDSIACIFLEDEDEHPRVQKRIDITSELVSSAGASVHRCRGRGSTRLSRLFSLISLGDFVSLYLAFLRQVDPTPVMIIEELKKRLREEAR